MSQWPFDIIVHPLSNAMPLMPLSRAPMPPRQVTAPFALVLSVLGVLCRVPGVLMSVPPAIQAYALALVCLMHLLAFVVTLAADLRTRRDFLLVSRGSRETILSANRR
jgi:hypothetical protein